MLNTGNFITTKAINQIEYTEENINKFHTYDVIYRHLLSFQQIPDYRVHIVHGLEYDHSVHSNSYYLTTINDKSTEIFDEIIQGLRQFI